MKHSVKNIMIIGDSYSTFEGYIPEGYATYYSAEETEKTDVRRVEETWWHRLCSEMGLKLVLNDSWSGSPIAYRGHNGKDCSHDSSFIYRFDKMVSDKFFEDNDVDTILIFGGTNDSWAGAPLGEVKYDNVTTEELFTVLPAITHFAARLAKDASDKNVIFIINTGLKPEIEEAIVLSCKRYGLESIKLSDIDKRCGHPTIKGMEQISEQVALFLNKIKEF